LVIVFSVVVLAVGGTTGWLQSNGVLEKFRTQFRQG
jgi:hypothetical protein